MKHIDTDKLRKAFRSRCAQLGIDPAAGANSYQACLLGAKAALAANQRQRVHRWWDHAPKWVDGGANRSHAEDRAFYEVMMACRNDPMVRMDDEGTLWHLVKDVNLELREEARQAKIRQQQQIEQLRQRHAELMRARQSEPLQARYDERRVWRSFP